MAIVGGGHNGLVAAAYLARLGLATAVFERRHLLGGAAVTEEIVPGYKYSSASRSYSSSSASSASSSYSSYTSTSPPPPGSPEPPTCSPCSVRPYSVTWSCPGTA